MRNRSGFTLPDLDEMPTPHIPSPVSSPAKRNPYLTKGMERCLRALRASEDEELVCNNGEVWVDQERFGPAILYRLLQHCLVRNESCSGEVGSGYEVYTINEDGNGVLDDPSYVPRIDRPNFSEPVPKARTKSKRHRVSNSKS